MPGTIILLNGTVSAGKTSIALALQEALPAPYLLLGADMLGAIAPARVAGGAEAAAGFAWLPVPDTDPPQVALTPGPYGHALVRGLHRAIRALADSGLNVVVDHILQDPLWRDDCLAAWRNLDVYLIGLRCPVEVAAEREQRRGDRVVGVARWQHPRVHTGMRYDLELDTAWIRPRRAAAAICRRVAAAPPRAAELLSERRL